MTPQDVLDLWSPICDPPLGSEGRGWAYSVAVHLSVTTVAVICIVAFRAIPPIGDRSCLVY